MSVTEESIRQVLGGVRFPGLSVDIVSLGFVESIRIDEDKLPPQAVFSTTLAKPGQRLQLPPRGYSWNSRMAQIAVVADDVESCRAALNAAAAAIVVTGEEDQA